jgi:hypothetical protein
LKKKKRRMSVSERDEHEIKDSSKIMKKKISKTTRLNSKNKHSSRFLWNHFLKEELLNHKEARKSELLAELLIIPDFTIKAITKELITRQIRKEGKDGFHKVQEFYKNILNILQRPSTATNNRFSNPIRRLVSWFNIVLQSSYEKFMLDHKMMLTKESSQCSQQKYERSHIVTLQLNYLIQALDPNIQFFVQMTPERLTYISAASNNKKVNILLKFEDDSFSCASVLDDEKNRVIEEEEEALMLIVKKEEEH